MNFFDTVKDKMAFGYTITFRRELGVNYIGLTKLTGFGNKIEIEQALPDDHMWDEQKAIECLNFIQTKIHI